MDNSVKQADKIDSEEVKNITLLTTSEKGLVGRIIDAVYIFFGMRGAAGSVSDFTYCLNQLKKHVLTCQKNGVTFSTQDPEIRAFKMAFNSRAGLLGLSLSNKKADNCVTQLYRDTFRDKLADKEIVSLAKICFATNKKGYSTKTKVIVGVVATALAAAGICCYGIPALQHVQKKKFERVMKEFCESTCHGDCQQYCVDAENLNAPEGVCYSPGNEVEKEIYTINGPRQFKLLNDSTYWQGHSSTVNTYWTAAHYNECPPGRGLTVNCLTFRERQNVEGIA